jgi:hypothetical protein
MEWKTEKENPQAFLHSSGRWLCKFWLSMLTRRLLSLTTLSMGIATLWPGGVTPLAATTSTTAVVSGTSLKLIADSDGSHSNEDIIFGFNGTASNFEEVMRLNEHGMISLDPSLNLPSYFQSLNRMGDRWWDYDFDQTVFNALIDARSDLGTVTDRRTFGKHGFSLGVEAAAIGADEDNPNISTSKNASAGRTSVYMNLNIVNQDASKESFRAMTAHLPKKDYPKDPYLMEYASRNASENVVRFAFGFPSASHPHRAVEALDVNGAIRIGGSFGDHAGTIRYHNGAFEGRTSSSWVNLGQNASSINSFTHSVNFSRGLQLGNTNSTVLGALRFHDGDFEGYDGAGWVSLTESELTRSARTDRSTDDIYLDDGHFGGDVSLTAEDSKLVFGVTGREGEIQDNYLVNSLYAPRDDDRPNFPNTGQIYADDVDSSGGVTLVTKGHSRFTVSHAGTAYFHNKVAVGLGNMVEGCQMTVAGAVHIGPSDIQPTTFDYSDELDNYLLWVENGIVSEDFAIANVDNWSDHVFDEDYDLMSLENVAEHIEASGHLPGVPSASEVAENGYTVHGMTRILLEKIEELTLHTIEQDKAIRELKAQLKGSAKKRSTRSLFSRLR